MSAQAQIRLVALLSLVILLGARPASASPGCGLGLRAQPGVLNFPSSSLPPSSAPTFGEVIDLNYSSYYVNRTLTVQYQNGSVWEDLGKVVGNGVGFTEVDFGVNSAWAVIGENRLRATGGGCTSEVAAFKVVSDPGAVPLDIAVYLALASALAGFLLVGRRLGWKRFAVVAGGIYLVVAPFTGQRYDIYFLLSSGIRVLQHVNPFDPGNPAVYPAPLKWAYPPLYTVYSAASFWVYQLFTGAALPSVPSLTYPGWLTSVYGIYQAYVPETLPSLVLLLKLPMIAGAFLTGALLRRMTGIDAVAVWWIANPLVILVAAVWGQLDPIATLFAVASLYYFGQGRHYHAYFFASLGAAVKVWPVLLIPILFAASAGKGGRKSIKPLVAVVPAALATVGLYAIFGSPLESLFVFVYARGIPTFAGAFSVNGLTWQELLLALNAPAAPLFLLVGIPLYAIMLGWIYLKKDADVVKWLVASILIFFLTYNYVNPQYFYWIIPLLVLQRRKLATLIFSLLPIVYVILSYNLFYFVSPAILPDQFSIGPSIVEQLKVGLFYQMPVGFALAAAIVPTAVYLWLLSREVGGRVRHRPDP